MLQIAICDDQPRELDLITTYIKEYLVTHSLEAEIKKFSHPDKLLTSIETENFHLYILDIVMPMVSGIELGKNIRRVDHEAQIIYATTEPQFALQAYDANPINYLIKPIDKQRLFDTLTFAITKIELSEEQKITVKTAENLRVLKLSEILCCEYRSHTVLFTLTSGEVISSRTIRERFAKYSMPLLKDVHFLQCHTSYIVNMRRVECFTKDRFILHGGKVVPIAVKQYPVVRDQYMNYLMAKGVQR